MLRPSRCVSGCGVALSKFIDQMVHESVRDVPHAHARHAASLRRALILPLGAGLAAPLLVVAQGALPLAQILALATCILPLASVLLLQRGHLVAAALVQIITCTALAAILVQGLGLFLAGFACLSLACLEAALIGRRDIVLGLGASAVLAILCAQLPAGSMLKMDVVLAAIGVALHVNLVAQLVQARESFEREHGMRLDEQAGLDALLADARLHFSRAAVVTHMDQACAKRFGLGRRDLAGRGFFKRVQMADRPALIKALGNALDQSAVQMLRVRVHLRDEDSARGRFVTPVFATLELRLKAIDEHHVMGLIRDVSVLVEAEAIVAAKRAAGLPDSDWKNQLIANVSHELRTPLNAIIGFSEILGADQARDEHLRREYAGIIHASGQHLLSLVNSILDMSQIEAGALPLTHEELCFADLVDECCDMMRLQAEQAGIVLRRQVQRDAHDMLADKRACRQILINLVSNAIKFTPRGGSVTIHAQQAGQDLLLAISDTGRGIAPEHMAQLGQAYYQAQMRDAQAVEGTGLGLALVKDLVTLQGGAMKIESTLGQGTCVTIRLPLDGRSQAIGQTTDRERSFATLSVPQPVAAPLSDMMMVKKIA